MTCDHTVKAFALADVHELNHGTVGPVMGKRLVLTGSWQTDGKRLSCKACGADGMTVPEAIQVSFAGCFDAKWHETARCYVARGKRA